MPNMKSKTNGTVKARTNGEIEIEVNTEFERDMAQSIADRLTMLTEQVNDLDKVRTELVEEQTKLLGALKALSNK